MVVDYRDNYERGKYDKNAIELTSANGDHVSFENLQPQLPPSNSS